MKTKILVLVMGMLLTLSKVHAITYTWTGAINNDFNISANWSPVGMPGSADVVVFNATSTVNCNINTSISVLGFAIEAGYTGTITQLPGFTITIGNNGFSQSDGTFIGGNSNIVITGTGTFNLSNGTFTATSASLRITGNRGSSQTLFNHLAGTFSHNNGTVDINPQQTGCTQRTFTVDVLPSTAFYNFTINANPSCGINPIVTTGTGDIVIASNDLTHTDGIINGSFEVRRDLYLNAGADGGTGKIAFTGTAAQQYFVASGTTRTCIIEVNKSSGTVTPGTGTTDFFMQAFILTQGSFTAPSGSMNIGGFWGSSQTLFNHLAGTFSHNNGTVDINPQQTGCTQRTFTVDVLPSTAFYNFTINANPSCGINPIVTTGTGDIVIASNDLTHTDGIINGSFEVRRDLYLNAGADGGTGKIAFTGTAAQQYFVASGTTRTCIIEVNKSSGTVTPGTGTTDFFMQAFILTQGSFTAPSGSMNIGGFWGSSQTLFNHLAGTFSHNNGTVDINPQQTGCTQRTFTVDVLPSTAFYNFTINANPSCGINPIVTTGTGDIVIASNDLTHTDGIINGSFEVRRDLYLNAGADGGTGKIAFTGTAAQQYFVASGTTRTCIIEVNKSSGTVTPGTGTTDFFMQAFILTQGSFTAPSGSMNIGGFWGSSQTLFNHLAGTFSHNNGTVDINPQQTGCTQLTFTVDVLPSTAFYNFTINANPSCGINPIVTTGTGDIVIASNDLTHTDGIINGSFEVRRDLYLNAGADGGTGKIAFTGTAAQQYFVASGTTRTCIIEVNKSSGTVTPGTGTTDFFMQAFILTQGSFTAPSGSMNIGGFWGSSQTLFNHLAGTFSHNNGTVDINPQQTGCTQRTFTVDVLPSTAFYNFTINANPSCGINPIVTTGTGDIVIASNDLTHTDGIINGSFEVRRDLYLNAGADGGTGKIAFTGTAAQQYFVASGTTRTCIIEVNKSSGTVTPGTGTTDFFMQAFILTQGSFTAPSGSMNIGGFWGSSQTLFNHLAGTFSHNNGTVDINPQQTGCTQLTFTVDVLPSTAFYNFIINANPSCGINPIVTTGTGDIVIASNDLTHTDGIINGSFEVRRDLYLNAGADGGTGKIAFTGTAAQQYFVASGTTRTCIIEVNKSSGTVTPGTGTTDFFMQAFILTQGSFTAPSGSMNIGGFWGSSQTLFNHLAGTFSHNNGTVDINPQQTGCTQLTFTVDVLPSTTFYNFIINANPSCGVNPIVTTAPGDILEVINQITYIDGICTARVELTGNAVVQSGHDGGLGRLTFKGSNAQTFNLSGATALFDGHVVINKTAGDVTLLSACQLDGVGQTLTFTQGRIISTTSNLLIIGNGVSVLTPSTASHVNGPVRKIGNQAFTFPVGKAGHYAPIQISAPALVTDHFTAEYFYDNPHPTYDNTSLDPTLDHISQLEYWILDRTGGTSNVTVRLSWGLRSCCLTDLADLRVARWDGSVWRDHGNGGTTGDLFYGTIVTAGVVTSFSPFTLASSSPANPLPVELVYFRGSLTPENVVLLEWKTASELNNDRFEIERSADGFDFTSLANIAGAGTTSQASNYSYIDMQPLSGTTYYRLKQIDFDGTFTYSHVVSVKRGEDPFRVYPNPAGKQWVTFNRKVNASVINSLNQVIGYYAQANGFDASILAPGVYVIRTHTGEIFKLVVH